MSTPAAANGTKPTSAIGASNVAVSGPVVPESGGDATVKHPGVDKDRARALDLQSNAQIATALNGLQGGAANTTAPSTTHMFHPLTVSDLLKQAAKSNSDAATSQTAKTLTPAI